MKRIIVIAFSLAMVMGALTGCSEATDGEYVTHEAEIVGKNIVYKQSGQAKIGIFITAPSTREEYKFDLREEDGTIVTRKVDKQDYYDFEIGDTYTY